MNGNNGLAADPTPPVERSQVRVRAIALIAIAVGVLAVSMWHFLAPPAAVHVATARPVPSLRTPVPSTPNGKRPYGVLHIEGLDIPAPEMHASEIAFIHTLVSSGFAVQWVAESAWDRQLDQADADIVTTDHGQVFAVAPHDLGHPFWACSRGTSLAAGGGEAFGRTN